MRSKRSINVWRLGCWLSDMVAPARWEGRRSSSLLSRSILRARSRVEAIEKTLVLIRRQRMEAPFLFQLLHLLRIAEPAGGASLLQEVQGSPGIPRFKARLLLDGCRLLCSG